MKNYEELLEKAKEWREWYYDGDPGTPEVAKSTEEAFNLINATLFAHISVSYTHLRAHEKDSYLV